MRDPWDWAADLLDGWAASLEAQAQHDPYSVLGLSQDATAQAVKRRFWELARVHHPDRGGDAETFKRLNRAKEAILHGVPSTF